MGTRRNDDPRTVREVALRYRGRGKRAPEKIRNASQVAAFFRRTEPHSPVSYLVERAVKWAEMPLEAWLSDVIEGDAALSTIKSTLGIKDSE